MKSKHPHPAFALLLAKARETSMPERFATDLTEHDARSLRQLPADKPFGWMLHKLGTWLVIPKPRHRQGTIDYVRGVFECASEGAVAFVWDGRALHPVATPDDMLEALYRSEASLAS